MSNFLKCAGLCKGRKQADQFAREGLPENPYKTCISCRTKARSDYRKKDKLHACTYQQCEKRFTSPADLRRHYESHNTTDRIKIRNFECNDPKCDHKALSLNDLEKHMKAVHSGIRDFKCSDCKFKSSLKGYLNKHTKVCTGGEHISAGEYTVRNVLESLSIQYAREMRFADCRDKQSLPFDFYLPNHRIAIEFDGEQHFAPNDRFGGLEAFQLGQAHDAIKNAYCIEKNIYLLRIKHTESRHTRELITEFLVQTEPSRIILEYIE